MEDGRCGGVDSFGDLGLAVSEELNAEQPAGCAVAGDADSDAVASGVVGLVVVGLGLDGERIEPGCDGFVVAQTCAGGDVVEDLHDLRAEAAGELAAAAERVFACDSSLFVRGRSEREIRLAEESVVGDDAVAGREDVGQVRPHLSVDLDRSLGAERGAGCGGQFAVRPHPDDDEDHVDRSGDG